MVVFHLRRSGHRSIPETAGKARVRISRAPIVPGPQYSAIPSILAAAVSDRGYVERSTTPPMKGMFVDQNSKATMVSSPFLIGGDPFARLGKAHQRRHPREPLCFHDGKRREPRIDRETLSNVAARRRRRQTRRCHRCPGRHVLPASGGHVLRRCDGRVHHIPQRARRDCHPGRRLPRASEWPQR